MDQTQQSDHPACFFLPDIRIQEESSSLEAYVGKGKMAYDWPASLDSSISGWPV